MSSQSSTYPEDLDCGNCRELIRKGTPAFDVQFIGEARVIVCPRCVLEEGRDRRFKL